MPERHTLGASMGDSTWDFAPDGQLKRPDGLRSFIGVRVARSMPRPVLSAFQQILERAQPVFDFFLCDPVARLHPANDAVRPACHHSQVVVGQPTPSFLHSAG
jgi:hypothetical protein